ncbi:MAG: hypothetical protein K2Q32_02355, partial [Alphaproteobacteria bacterium]|nr:hypothetical protein [Alphaproteobacteria bacterium]
MSEPPISPIITRHLNALVRTFAHTIPSSFQGATGERHNGVYYGVFGPIPKNDVHPAMHELCPPSLFIAYAEHVIADPNLFQRDSVKKAISCFLHELDLVIDAIEQGETGRYHEPAWQPAGNLRGKVLSEKSTGMQKIHAIDAIIKNPN